VDAAIAWVAEHLRLGTVLLILVIVVIFSMMRRGSRVWLPPPGRDRLSLPAKVARTCRAVVSVQ
jgi:hypothetical protein